MADSEEKPVKFERRMLRERRFPPSLIPVLASLKAVPKPHAYCVVDLPAGSPLPSSGARLLSLVRGEKLESYVLLESEWAALQPTPEGAEVEKGFRILTLSPLPRGHEGNFMAVISGMLADALVNSMPVWSPRRIDLLLKSTELKTAREAIDLLVNRAKGRARSG